MTFFQIRRAIAGLFRRAPEPMTPIEIRRMMVGLHGLIESYADHAVRSIINQDITLVYPPNHTVTEAECRALHRLNLSPDARSALKKIIANTTAETVFSLLNYVDGTTDPPGDEDWDTYCIVRRDEFENGGEMLHDLLFETWWEWKDTR